MILYNFTEKKTLKEHDSYCKMKHTSIMNDQNQGTLHGYTSCCSLQLQDFRLLNSEGLLPWLMCRLGDASLPGLYLQHLSKHCSEDRVTNRHLNFKVYYLGESHIKLTYLHSRLGDIIPISYQTCARQKCLCRQTKETTTLSILGSQFEVPTT